MSDPNRHSFTLAISPPPADGGDALPASASTPGSTAEDVPRSVAEPLHLTLSVETPGRDVIRISAVDGRGRRYKGNLSLRADGGGDLCFVCDANGCRWVSPCPEI